MALLRQGYGWASREMKNYNPKGIEKKWQEHWAKLGIYQAKDSGKQKKYYVLVEFPYPSGDGLHTGHVRSYTAMDIIARKRRMEGYNVLYPMGWDAFGLPTENYAIKTGRQPQEITKENTDTFRSQLRALGMSFDWSREINTTDPKYYKWTQWIFLRFFEKGLAYKAEIPINWCPKDRIGLANEEVVNGSCERCGTPVEKKKKRQWMLAITKYADRLLEDLETVDYPERVKVQQRNWIGRSEGMLFSAPVKDMNLVIETFSAHFEAFRADTFVVIAPDHPLLEKLVKGLSGEKEVLDFANALVKERGSEDFDEKEPKGIFTGRYIIDPVGNGDLPIWVASYALADYGTGIVKCSAHDERDFKFAQKYDIPLKEVLMPRFVDSDDPPREGVKTVERRAVLAIVTNPKNGKVLCLKWKKFPWTTFITGGVEKGEDIAEAATREVREETGYQNLKYLRTLGGPVEVNFYAKHKSENRKALFNAVAFELVNDERNPLSAKEEYLHKVSWMSWEELEKDKNLKCTEYVIWKERFFDRLSAPIKIEDGILLEPEEFAGRKASEAREEIIKYLEEKKFARRSVTYKLRDWVFSRQRYWGEPIPIINCQDCGPVPVPEKDLPVGLPPVKDFKPGKDGESPLSSISSWVKVECPKCGRGAERETDVMPNWAGSSWYFYRYSDPHNDEEFASMDKLKYWMGVDWYNGGMEHTVLHLLYSRFWNKFLFDLKLVPTNEPYQKRTSHGLILAEGGEKMSKSKGNVINPDAIIKSFGADTLRLYEMFMGPFEQAIAWKEDALVGPRRFLERVWELRSKIEGGSEREDTKESRETVAKVSEDIERLKFNTAVSSLMIFTNHLDRKAKIAQKEFETLLLLLAPFAPHLAEELWHTLNHRDSIHSQSWPTVKTSETKGSEVTLAIQINGKVRASFTAKVGEAEEELKKTALSLPEVRKWLTGKEVRRVIIVPGKIISIVA